MGAAVDHVQHRAPAARGRWPRRWTGRAAARARRPPPWPRPATPRGWRWRRAGPCRACRRGRSGPGRPPAGRARRSRAGTSAISPLTCADGPQDALAAVAVAAVAQLDGLVRSRSRRPTGRWPARGPRSRGRPRPRRSGCRGSRGPPVRRRARWCSRDRSLGASPGEALVYDATPCSVGHRGRSALAPAARRAATGTCRVTRAASPRRRYDRAPPRRPRCRRETQRRRAAGRPRDRPPAAGPGRPGATAAHRRREVSPSVAAAPSDDGLDPPAPAAGAAPARPVACARSSSKPGIAIPAPSRPCAGSLAARARAGSAAGMPSVTLCAALLGLLEHLPVGHHGVRRRRPPTSPKTCGWRATSLSWTPRATSARVNRPSSAARQAWKYDLEQQVAELLFQVDDRIAGRRAARSPAGPPPSRPG